MEYYKFVTGYTNIQAGESLSSKFCFRLLGNKGGLTNNLYQTSFPRSLEMLNSKLLVQSLKTLNSEFLVLQKLFLTQKSLTH